MKILAIIVLTTLVLSTTSGAQNAKFILSDSSVIHRNVSQVDPETRAIHFMRGTSIVFEDVVRMYVTEQTITKKMAGNIEVLKSSGIKVFFAKSKKGVLYPPDLNDPIYTGKSKIKESSLIVESEATPQQIIKSLKAYESGRSTGKAFQLLGALGLTFHFIQSELYRQKIEDGDSKAKAPSLLIPIAACGAISVGFAIDLSAGSPLKFRK